MRRFVTSLLLTLSILCATQSTANACCCLLPLLNPFCWFGGCGYGYGMYGPAGYAGYPPPAAPYGSWGYGASGYPVGGYPPGGYVPPPAWNGGTGCCLFGTPYTFANFVDDWLGYGYLKYQSPGFAGNGWSCYNPLYPLLGGPGYGAGAPWCGPTWNNPGWGGYSGNWSPQVPMMCPPNPCPPYPCPPDPCQPVCPQPIAVRVPVTTYRSVTVDQGHWQQVWVPRPVTQCVPETTWQVRQVYPGGWNSASAAPAMMPPQQVSMGYQSSNCGDTPCQNTAGTPQMQSAWSPGMTAPAATAWNPGTGWGQANWGQA
ncbi:MAG: hypothetical protein KDA96_23330, partial [Planctomycetaceae bacterium]|nr:hypothetical protein [Planctomycetaceae bacterium]